MESTEVDGSTRANDSDMDNKAGPSTKEAKKGKKNYESISRKNVRIPTGTTSDEMKEEVDDIANNQRIKRLKLKCIKNIVFIGIAGFCTHIIGEITASLASSLSADVVRAMTVKVYGVLVGCYLAPVVIKIIGAKFALVLGPFMSAILIASLLEANDIVLLISLSCVCGLFIGVFYATALCHVMDCTFTITMNTSQSMQTISSFTNAYLWLMFSLSGVTGNLIISLHLQKYKNATTPRGDFFHLCGNKFCPDYMMDTDVIIPPTRDSIETLIYIFIGIALVGFLVIAVFLEKLNDESAISKSRDTSEICHQLLCMLKLFGDPRLLLLIPVIITHGMVQMFPEVDYTQSYITCTVGVQHVGYAMVCLTASNCLGNLISGALGTVIQPRYIILAGFTSLAALFIVLLASHLIHLHAALLYAFPAMMGFFDGLTRTQLSAYTVVLLKDKSDGASSAYFMLTILGHCFVFTWHVYLCMYVKVYLMLSLAITSAVSFAAVDTLASYRGWHDTDASPDSNGGPSNSTNCETRKSGE